MADLRAIVLSLALGGVPVLAPRVASADPATPSVVVWAEGPYADQARAEVTSSLGSDARAVDPGAWRDAFRRTGRSDSIGRDLARHTTRAKALDRARRAAETAGVSEVVLVSTARAKGGDHVADVFLVSPGREPEVLTHVPLGVAAGGLGLTVHHRIALAHPPPPVPEPATVDPPSAKQDLPLGPRRVERSISAGSADTTLVARRGRDRHSFGDELFELAAGGEVSGRNFKFNDPLTGNLRSYQVVAAPLFVVDGAVYPFADLKVPVLRDIGAVRRLCRKRSSSSPSRVSRAPAKHDRRAKGAAESRHNQEGRSDSWRRRGDAPSVGRGREVQGAQTPDVELQDVRRERRASVARPNRGVADTMGDWENERRWWILPGEVISTLDWGGGFRPGPF